VLLATKLVHVKQQTQILLFSNKTFNSSI